MDSTFQQPAVEFQAYTPRMMVGFCGDVSHLVLVLEFCHLMVFWSADARGIELRHRASLYPVYSVCCNVMVKFRSVVWLTRSSCRHRCEWSRALKQGSTVFCTPLLRRRFLWRWIEMETAASINLSSCVDNSWPR